MKFLRLFFFLLVLTMPICLYAQTVYVNSSTGSDVAGDGSSGSPYKTFTKGYSMVSSGGTLDVTGTFTWADAGETGDVADNGSTTQVSNGFSIDKSLTIKGQGADQTIIQGAASSGTANSRLFVISTAGITVTFQGLEMRYGKTTYLGGAVYPWAANTVNIINCYIHDNDAYQGGGACRMDGNCTVILQNSTLSNNHCGSGNGGAIENSSTAGTLTVTNTTICNNSVTIVGGNGIAGGIYLTSSSGSTYITNCTIVSNTTTQPYGGGLCQDGGTLYLKNNMVANNSSSEPTINDYEFWAGTLIDNGYNIVEFYTKTGSGTGTLNGTGDKTGNQSNLFGTGVSTTPSLAMNNAANGTPTIKTTTGSVAINAGNSSANGLVNIPTTDQRGAARSGATDIGAYEWWDDAGTLPVELTSFIASTVDNKVTLNWNTATEVNNYGFEIERRAVKGEVSTVNSWMKIGFVEGAGTSNSPKEYSFTDSKLTAGKYEYRLKQVDNNGSFKYLQGLEIEIAVAKEFALNQNYPNPFNPTTTITYDIPNVETQHAVSLRVYDILGKEVATLVNEIKDAGSYSVEWNASSFASGMYFYRLESGNNSLVKKLLLVK